jgi:hypothetical protein
VRLVGVPSRRPNGIRKETNKIVMDASRWAVGHHDLSAKPYLFLK